MTTAIFLPLFFQALAAFASQEIDPFEVGPLSFQIAVWQARTWYRAWETINPLHIDGCQCPLHVDCVKVYGRCGHTYWIEPEYVDCACPECVEFEQMCEAEYQASLQAK